MKFENWITLGIFLISFVGGLYAVIRVIVLGINHSEKIKELEKENTYLRGRVDTLTDGVRNLK